MNQGLVNLEFGQVKLDEVLIEDEILKMDEVCQ